MTGAELRENLLVALDTLRSHKIRSSLTILGIVIGVTSVISVASIIDGLNRYIQDKVESFGARTYFVSRIPVGPRFGRLPEKIRLRKYIQDTDAEFVRSVSPSVDFVTTFGTRAFFFGDSNDIRYNGNVVERIIIRGAEPEYADAIPLFSVARGRFITKYDEDHSRNVAVLGAAVADSLFNQIDPIGKVVRMNGREFEVIGIFEKDPGFFGGPGVDQFAVIPFSFFRKLYPESKELILAFSIAKGVNPERAKDEVTEAMRRCGT